MSLAKLIRYKVLMALRGFTRGNRRKRIARLVGAAGITAAVAIFVAVAFELFAALKSIGPTGEQAAAVVIALTFHAILLLAFVFDIATTANIFFLSSDLGLLMAAPLRTIKIFALKYLEAIAAVSFVALVIGLPVVIGYGAGLGAPAVFYPVAIAAIVVFLTIPVSAGTICGLLISRFVRAGRVRELLAVLGGVIGLGVWLGFQMLKPAADVQEIQNISSRINSLASGGAGLLNLLPSRFPAQIITATVSSDWSRALPAAASLLAISGAMFVVSLVLAERIYVTGWTRAVPAAGKRRRRRKQTGGPGRGRRAARLLRWLPPVERSIFETTARLIFRDPQQITPIATITIMMALFPFFVGRSGRAALRPGLLLYSISMLSFTGSMNLATSAIMIHGRSFWHVLLAPASSLKRLGAHLAVSASFFSALGVALATVFGLAGFLDWLSVAKAAWLAACFALVGSSAGILMAVSFGDWEWDTPKRMMRLAGRLVSVGVLLGLFGLVGLALGFFSGQAGQAGLPPGLNLPWRALVAGAAAAALLAGILMAASVAKVSRMEWRV
jgi:ABC-2 type transport system permease protein